MLLEEEEQGEKITSGEAVDYVLGAMSAWHILRLDEEKFQWAESRHTGNHGSRARPTVLAEDVQF